MYHEHLQTENDFCFINDPLGARMTVVNTAVSDREKTTSFAFVGHLH